MAKLAAEQAEAAKTAQNNQMLSALLPTCLSGIGGILGGNESTKKNRQSITDVYNEAAKSSPGHYVDDRGTFRSISVSTDYGPMPECLSPAPARPGTAAKITSYGYEKKGDKYWDSNSANGIGVQDIKLRPGDCALSRDLRQNTGAKVGDTVSVHLSNGRVIFCRYADITADVYKGKEITGRVDLYTPNGPPANDGQRVVGISLCKK
jgi:hypothetical protein